MRRTSILMFILAAVSMMLAVWVSGLWLQFLISAIILFLAGAFFLGASETEGTRR